MTSAPTREALQITERVLLLGAGREGRSTYDYLRRHYPSLYITIADQTPLENLGVDFREVVASDPYAEFVTGEEYLQPLATHDVVFKSPGISPLLPPIAAAEKRGVLITSNVQFFFEDTIENLHIGVTGTKGKSTTTAMIYAILHHAGKDVRLLGNIGTAPLSVLDDTIQPDTIFVIELSSYQLYDCQQSPEIAVIQNIVPEHLTWHGNFEAYVDAKTNITRYQTETDTLVYATEYELPKRIAASSSAKAVPFGFNIGDCVLEDGWLVCGDEPIISVEEVPLQGVFNMLNVMPGILIARQFGIETATIAAGIRSFEPLEHRMQYVATVNDVRYYNDSLATVPEATVAAITGLRPATVVLIAGGYDREVSYDVLAQCILDEQVRYMLLFPTTGERIVAALNALNTSTAAIPPYQHVTTMKEAVELAAQHAQPDDVVLMSPASASFNLFRDYKDRGDQFMAAVRNLK